MNKIQLQTLATNVFLKRLVESVSGDASSAQKQAQQLAVDLKADGMDVTDDEVQAAMLGALIDADGNIQDVDVSDVEKIANDIKEGRLHEAAGVLGMIHQVGDVLGNAAFIHVLAEGITKLTGKTVDEAKLKARLEKIFGMIKKVSGFVAHQIERAFEWLAKKFGASETGQKIAGISGLLILTISMFVIGIVLFPSVTSTTAFIITTVALIGKGGEMYVLAKKLYNIAKDQEAEIAAKKSRGEANFGAE